MSSQPGTSVDLTRSREQLTRQRMRVDSFMNLITGLGDPTRDKRLSARVAAPNVLDYASLEALYTGDAIAGKIVDALPEDMCREWIEYVQGDDAAAEEAVMEKLRDIEAQENIEWALKMARLHGGAVIVLGVNDGRNFDEPLDEENIQSLNYLNVLDRWQIYPTQQVFRDPTKPNYGKPEFYRLAPARHSMATGEVVHASRLIRFDGVRMPDRSALRNLGWGDSILNRLYNAIRSYHTAHDSAAVIIQDFTQGVYTFKGLASLLLQGDAGVEALQARLLQNEMARSIVRAFILDEDEKFEKVTTPINGLEKLVESAERRLVAEADMPHSKLLGESPGASLGEGGAYQTRAWYDYVAAKQKSLMRRPVERIIEILLRARTGPTHGQVPDSWKIDFKTLWQVDEKEQAQNRYLQAQADQIYIQEGVVTAEDIARSRFGQAGYSTDTVVDLEARGLLGGYEGEDDPSGEAPDV